MRLLALCLTYILLEATNCSGVAVMAQDSQRWSVELEVMVQPSPRDRVNAQKWGNLLAQLGRRATFRQGQQGEKTRLEEIDRTGRKAMRAVGLMNRDGTLSFTGKVFRLSKPDELQAWIRELETHGPKGPADESATWGLSPDQLSDVLRRLGGLVTKPVDERSPVAIIDSLDLRSVFRVTYTDAARRRITTVAADAEPNSDYVGLTKGTVFAAALAQFGLGYRPKHADDGAFYLEVDAGDEGDNLFPVGWKSTTPITLLVPELSKRITVDLEEAVPLEGLINLIAQKLNQPVLYSDYDLKVAGIRPTEIEYSRKRSRLTVYSLIRTVSLSHHLGISLRTDEAGSVFLWVTTEEQEDAFKRRFAHVRPTP